MLTVKTSELYNSSYGNIESFSVLQKLLTGFASGNGIIFIVIEIVDRLMFVLSFFCFEVLYDFSIGLCIFLTPWNLVISTYTAIFDT